MTGLLRVVDLVASYGKTKVLHGLSFDIGAGQITTLLGANGAGKTSTLRAICGALRREGVIELSGQSIAREETETIARLGIAHVPDGRGTFTRLTVEENLQLGGVLRRDTEGVKRDIDRMYDCFPILRQRRRQQAGALSGGEQQMLAVGRALMSRPKLLLLDEPSFGLAPLVVKDLFAIFRRLNREDGVSMLLVEQNAALALDIADTAYLLETGRIVFSGAASVVRQNDGIRRAYLGG
ncbi:MAG: ABC transporter ATP-binding protein [Rubrivivax sp.]|jgi:branched-chain amino acid transport system ATP-binding protein